MLSRIGLSKNAETPIEQVDNNQKGWWNMINGNQELNEYVLRAQGLSRKGLNIMCFIGIFIFGWLLAIAFESLGRKKQGWFYVVPIIGFLVISRESNSPIGFLAPVLYVVGWVHANRILSGYQSSAQDRIVQIDRLSEGALTTDVVLEKGILQSKVLSDDEAAGATFLHALQMPGGDAQLLNLAGIRLYATKQYAEAKQFFDRALSCCSDDALTKQIKRNQVNVEKKLK